MEEVPLKTIRCGKFSKKQGCFLSLQETAPGLEFLWRNVTDKDEECVRFQCGDISAVDLRVETKFGSIDAMKGRIIVECLSPVLEQHAPPPKGNNKTGSENFIIEATFHVDETGEVRDIIQKLRDACLSKKRQTHEDENGSSSKESTTTKAKIFKEGLPDWVSFIPHHFYSRSTRRFIQLAIFIYMVFSVTWALWQLYRHVDFIQELVAPLVDMLQYQYQILDNILQLLNTIFEEYTIQWLCFIKPLYTLTNTLASPLWNVFRQFNPLLSIILQVLTVTWNIFRPVAKPIITLGYFSVQFIFTMFRSLKTIMTGLWSPLNSASDHLILMRTTVINSSKALSLGVIRLAKKIYKIIWLRRSARAEKEE